MGTNPAKNIENKENIGERWGKDGRPRFSLDILIILAILKNNVSTYKKVHIFLIYSKNFFHSESWKKLIKNN